EGVVAGVDVIGADLVRGDLQAAGPQRAQQAGGDRRLAVAAAGRRDDNTGDVHHSMPRCPFWPASIGCLTLVISVTRSAAAMRSWCASRPVITTCWCPGRPA